MRIRKTLRFVGNLSHIAAVSTALAITLMGAGPAIAHEVLPAIADMEQKDDTLVFEIRLGVESFIAGIDLTVFSDTNESPQAEVYDELRALDPGALESRFIQFWPQMQDRVQVIVDGERVALNSPVLIAGPVGDVEAVRDSVLSFSAPLPDGAETVQVGWDAGFGTLVIRQQGVDDPYDGYLQAGAMTDPIQLSNGKSWLGRLFD